MGDILIFEYVGMKTQELQITDKCTNETIQSQLKTKSVNATTGVVVIKKRSFFSRAFHSFGNLFR